MAVDDVERTRVLLPQLFDLRRGDTDWTPGWIIGELERPDGLGDEEIDGLVANTPTNWPSQEAPAVLTGGATWVQPRVYRGKSPVPGMPVSGAGSSVVPPSDAWAFYLPFHYFSEDVWGIYILLDGIVDLSHRVQVASKWRVDSLLAAKSARRFLYFHELFHHQVESAALRLEIDRRRPWYRTGFEALYRERLAAGTAAEEAIANASGIAKSVDRARKEGVPAASLDALKEALVTVTEGMPPSYRGASRFLGARAFDSGCNVLVEESRARCLRSAPGDAEVWNAAPYLFRGMATIRSRVNWIVRDGTRPISGISGFSRLVSRTKFERALRRNYGLEYVSNNGKHEKWAVGNVRVPVPRHRVLNRHTAQGILKQLGLNVRVEELLAF